MAERNVFQKSGDRVLLRTDDVYQTEVADEVTSYSERLLAIVADFKNSGAPRGSTPKAWWGSPSAARWLFRDSPLHPRIMAERCSLCQSRPKCCTEEKLWLTNWPYVLSCCRLCPFGFGF